MMVCIRLSIYMFLKPKKLYSSKITNVLSFNILCDLLFYVKKLTYNTYQPSSSWNDLEKVYYLLIKQPFLSVYVRTYIDLCLNRKILLPKNMIEIQTHQDSKNVVRRRWRGFLGALINFANFYSFIISI